MRFSVVVGEYLGTLQLIHFHREWQLIHAILAGRDPAE